jgi:hypothetical protein
MDRRQQLLEVFFVGWFNCNADFFQKQLHVAAFDRVAPMRQLMRNVN